MAKYWIEDRGKEWNGRRWRVRYRAPDRTFKSRSFERKADAERWGTDQASKLDRGEWHDPAAGKITFGEWAEKWLRGLHSIRPKTVIGYEGLLRSRILPTFARVELRHITTPMVREWQADLLDQVSAARTRQARQVLFAALAQATDDGLIGKNPVDKVKAPTAAKRRQMFLTDTQVRSLAEAAEARQPRAGALVIALAYSGMRWGEAVALRWGAVSVERRRLRVRESMSELRGKVVFNTPKTDEGRAQGRTLILPRFVIERLGPPGDPDQLVFTAPRGGPLRHSNFRASVWVPAVRAAQGVPDGLMIHDLRDTAASFMISNGGSIKAVQRALGHASAAMTLDVYGGLFTEDLEDLADRMEARYAQVVSEANVISLPVAKA